MRGHDTALKYEQFLPTPCAQNHASNIMYLPNGDLLCAWFGGSQEGRADISIYLSRLTQESLEWSHPIKLSNDETRSEQNPVIFPVSESEIWVLFTAQISGRQNTAEVRYVVSLDGGFTWSDERTLFDTPGTFIRQPMVVLKNGTWLLPVFYCPVKQGEKWAGNYDYSAVKISEDQGKTWIEYEVPCSTGRVHMNIEPLSDGTLLALFRSRWADRIYVSKSRDNGKTWNNPVPLQLPNNNSSIQFVRLNNGHLALVFNNVDHTSATERRTSLYDEIEDHDDLCSGADSPEHPQGNHPKAFWGTPRAPLTVAISEDEGETWPFMRNLEVGDGYCMTNNSEQGLNREFSYPSIKQTSNDDIHITYTYFRQKIKYVKIQEKWIKTDNGER